MTNSERPSWEENSELDQAELQAQLAGRNDGYIEGEPSRGCLGWLLYMLNPLNTLDDWAELFTNPLGLLTRWLLWLLLLAAIVWAILRWLF